MSGDMEAPLETSTLLAPTSEFLATFKVFPLIHLIKQDVVATIDSGMSWDQLLASDVNFAIVRPLVMKYSKLKNFAVVYAFLAVRAHFLSSADEDLAFANIRLARATFCELLAIKMLRDFATQPIELVAALTTPWSALAGAPEDIVTSVRHGVGQDEAEEKTSALEMAIATKSKHFLSSPLVQTVVNDIYTGRITYSATSERSLVADNYKQREIEVYDFKRAGFLNHYRLRVPRYGSILEFLNFSVLMFTYLLCLSSKDLTRMTPEELVFIIFAFAFALDEYAASREHGWNIYMANVWNSFDVAFVTLFLSYFGLRMHGLANQDHWANDLAFDILACAACILFPRLAFFVISNNVVIIALQGMIAEFLFFIIIAIICFSGLLFTFWEFGSDSDTDWSLRKIAWLMIQIWFGNTSLSFGVAESFHPIFGPPLMVIYAAMSNTLLITILISILSNTFARIDQHATQEYLFQFAISTIEGMKSDALFSYQPPFNLVAYALLWPMSFIVSPRKLHSVNVFMIRVTSFPILITIAVYERYFAPGSRLRPTSKEGPAAAIFNSLPKQVKSVALVESIMGVSGSQDLMDAVFEVDISQDTFADFFEDGQEEGMSDRGRPGDELSPNGKRDRSKTPQGRRTPIPSLPSSPAGVKADFDASTGRAFSSPLAKLFGRRPISKAQPQMPLEYTGGQGLSEALSSFKKMEAAVDAMKDLPVSKLRDDVKELKEQQARIESLLTALTRGMTTDAHSMRG